MSRVAVAGATAVVTWVSANAGSAPVAIRTTDEARQGYLAHAIIWRTPADLGAERTRQRTHFDALTLLGVFIQHGDRKHQQQRLYCAAPIDTTAADLRAVDRGALMLFERPDTDACPSPAVEILDLGLTFGGAGHTSNGSTAGMDLAACQDQPVFRPTESGECRGHLTVSFKADGGESNPLISEQGRLFLLEQLRRLTPAHVRAIFAAARVDQLEHQSSPTGVARIDAWVAAFANKVRQIEARRCPELAR